MKLTQSLTFDDVLIRPAYSKVLPREVDTKTKFSSEIDINIPIISAAMDTVTEAKLTISISQCVEDRSYTKIIQWRNKL